MESSSFVGHFRAPKVNSFSEPPLKELLSAGFIQILKKNSFKTETFAFVSKTGQGRHFPLQVPLFSLYQAYSGEQDLASSWHVPKGEERKGKEGETLTLGLHREEGME